MMDAEIKERLTSRDVWMRALYMLFFAIAYGVTEIIITLLVIFQFLTILFTGHANELLLRFGHNLGVYVFQILQFETFNSEERPFPFAEWPDEDPGENRWLRNGASTAADKGMASESPDAGSAPGSENDSTDAAPGIDPTDPRVR